MDIRFVSTLTADDENLVAAALLRALSGLLDATPIAYSLRIETLDGDVLEHTHPACGSELSSANSRSSVRPPLRRLADA